MKYNSEVALPYKGNENVSISPDPGKDFSLTRMYAGRIRAESTTVPIGSMSLNGWFSTTNVADCRDVMELGTETYAVSELLQQSISSKDALKQIPVQKGVVATIGCDIPNEFTPPDTLNLVHCQGAMEHFNFTHPGFSLGPLGGGSTLTPHRNDIIGMTRFFTPYDLEYTDGYGVVPTVRLSKIPPFTVPEFSVDTEFVFKCSNSATSQFNLVLEVKYIHYYAGISNTIPGKVDYTTFEYRSFVAGDDCVLVTPNVYTFTRFYELCSPPIRADHRDRLMDPNSIYLGTVIGYEIVSHLISGTGVETFSITPTSSLISNVHVNATDIYNQGSLGPVRILRWDEVGNGQVINVRGRLAAECIAEGAIAPYVNSSALTNNVSFNVNLFGLISNLYNSTNPFFKRIYTGEEYDALVQEIRHNGVKDLIAGHSSFDNNMRMIASAAGVFENLGGDIGGIFGGRGREIGGNIGGVVDKGITMAERFGAAAGQFGGLSSSSAAGQFGMDDMEAEAAGRFGSRRRVMY